MLIKVVHRKELISNEGEFGSAASDDMLNAYRNGFDTNGYEDLFIWPNANVVCE